MDLSGAKFNRVWRRKGAFWNRKGQKSTQKKLSSISPSFKGFAVGKQPTKI
jgi:hypothetical protein